MGTGSGRGSVPEAWSLTAGCPGWALPSSGHPCPATRPFKQDRLAPRGRWLPSPGVATGRGAQPGTIPSLLPSLAQPSWPHRGLLSQAKEGCLHALLSWMGRGGGVGGALLGFLQHPRSWLPAGAQHTVCTKLQVPCQAGGTGSVTLVSSVIITIIPSNPG